MELLISTGCGNTIQGGSDVWTNHFLKLVYPIIKKNTEYTVLIDGKKPLNWEMRGFPEINVHFDSDSRERSLELLKIAQKIHFLNSSYLKRDYLMDFKDKFGIIFVHAYPDDMLDINLEGRRIQLNVGLDPDGFKEFLSYADWIVWIGIDGNSKIFNDFARIRIISNFYEFKHNIPIRFPLNKIVGYTARMESRKNAHFLDGLPAVALTNVRDWGNMKETYSIDDSRVRMYHWEPNILDSFMKKSWSISHSAHAREPFGYSIFQAVDWGKVPIINSDWGFFGYKYRASTKKEFLSVYNQILSDSQEEIINEVKNIREYMRKYDNKSEWIKLISELF